VPEALESELPNEIGDDRDNIKRGDRALLVVDNDLSFAKFLMEVARESGFKVIVTSSGVAALALAHEHQPSAITLDISLPDLDGWRVLGRLKSDPALRHIPVHVISTADDIERGRPLGALAILPKPIQTREVLEEALALVRSFADRSPRRLLYLESGSDDGHRVHELIGSERSEINIVSDVNAAVELLRDRAFDCIVLDADLAALPLEELAQAIDRDDCQPRPGVIVHAGRGLSPQAEAAMRYLAHTVRARQVRSLERLVDQVALALHAPLHSLPPLGRSMIENLYTSESILAGRRVLIVDDDIRNIFALASVLERHQMKILSAETGRDAIRILKETPDIDMVLMDIMMPEMDGIATMRELRKLPQLKSLPIVAVTAKAMKGDREKCIEAGAWDYLSKPVDPDQMLSVLRAWLYR
jgi:CheY-like chemotaxis protein